MKKILFLTLITSLMSLSLSKNKLEKEQKIKYKMFELTEGIMIKMIWVSPGTFLMGNSALNNQHKVTLTKGYWLAETELTQNQWQKVMKKNPSQHKGANLPVEQVSYYDVLEFIKKINVNGDTFRLPTEAEWEYACRAGTNAPYAGDKDAMVWHKGNSGIKSHEVATKQPNPWGFYDMQGNILEWCSDWFFQADHNKFLIDPIGPKSGMYKVQRGGQFTGRPRHTEAHDRQKAEPNKRDFYVGFRLAHDSIKKK